MKNFKLSFAVLAIIAFFATGAFTGCGEQEKENAGNDVLRVEFKKDEIISITAVNNYLDFVRNNKTGPIISWIKAHNGTTLFSGCDGNGACGPCPGICFLLSRESKVVPIVKNDLTEQDNIVEFRKLPNDSSKIIVSFKTPENFVANDNFYVPEDTDLGKEVAGEYYLKQLILKKGIYPMSYLYNGNGETVVNLKN